MCQPSMPSSFPLSRRTRSLRRSEGGLDFSLAEWCGAATGRAWSWSLHGWIELLQRISLKLVRRTECSSLSLGRCSWCMKSRSWSTVASRGVQQHRNWEKLCTLFTSLWWRWVWSLTVEEGVTQSKEKSVHFPFVVKFWMGSCGNWFLLFSDKSSYQKWLTAALKKKMLQGQQVVGMKKIEISHLLKWTKIDWTADIDSTQPEICVRFEIRPRPAYANVY